MYLCSKSLFYSGFWFSFCSLPSSLQRAFFALFLSWFSPKFLFKALFSPRFSWVRIVRYLRLKFKSRRLFPSASKKPYRLFLKLAFLKKALYIKDFSLFTIIFRSEFSPFWVDSGNSIGGFRFLRSKADKIRQLPNEPQHSKSRRAWKRRVGSNPTFSAIASLQNQFAGLFFRLFKKLNLMQISLPPFLWILQCISVCLMVFCRALFIINTRKTSLYKKRKTHPSYCRA